jgi:hypothetical protein
MKHPYAIIAVVAAVSMPALVARAAVDGTVGAGEYGLTLATQTNTTGFGNNESELNRALAQFGSDGQLQLMLTGNLQPNGNGMVIFIDARAGGGIASTTAGGYGMFGSVGGAKTDDWGLDTDGGFGINAPPGGPSVLSPGFNPEISFEINAGGGGPNYYINVIDLTVPNEPNPNRDIFLHDPLDDTRSGTFGNAAVATTYVRDTGPAGAITYAFDNTNTAGVNGDGDVNGLGDPASATTGFEALFSSLFLNSDPGQPIKLMAFITNGGGEYLSNQFLPGLPLGTPNLTTAGAPGGTPLFDAENGFTPSLANLVMTVPFPEWGKTGGGSWSVDANWLVAKPDGVNVTAKFGSALTSSSIINVDGPHTVGALIFDNPTFSYNFGGAGSIIFDALAGKTTRVNVLSGNHTIGVTTNWQKNMRVSTAAGSSIAFLNPFIPAAGISLTKDGPGTAQFVNVRIDAVDVQGGTLRVAAGATANNSGRTSVVKNLTIAPGAKLDLTNNSAIIDYTGPVGILVDDTRLNLQSGRLTTTSGSTTLGLGYADNAALDAVKTSFAGQTVDPSSILIKFTYFGDTDLDGDGDVADLGKLATAWQTSSVW